MFAADFDTGTLYFEGTRRSHLTQTSSDWNSGNSAVLTAIVGGTSSKRCSMVLGTTQVCNGTYGNNGWLGLASINISGDHIT